MISEDCRGLACPAPVIKAKNALTVAGGRPIRIIVDDGAPRENVRRFAETNGCTVNEVKFENGWQLTLQPGVTSPDKLLTGKNRQQAAILIGSDRLGEGPDELGRLLMKSFIITLLELPDPPESIYFLNSGVLLTTSGSELLEPLNKLAAAGTGIFSCGVCLDYFGLREKLAAGSITNMYTIAEKMLISGHSITL